VSNSATIMTSFPSFSDVSRSIDGTSVPSDSFNTETPPSTIGRATYVSSSKETQLSSVYSGLTPPEFAAEYIRRAQRVKPSPRFQQAQNFPLRRDFTYSKPSYESHKPRPAYVEKEDEPVRGGGRIRTPVGPSRHKLSKDIPNYRPPQPEKSRQRWAGDPYIVEPPSPSLPLKKPSPKAYSSATPIWRREPTQSKTQEYPYPPHSVSQDLYGPPVDSLHFQETLNYQQDVSSPTIPITIKIRRRQRRRGPSSSRSTESSGSWDESDYKSATTRSGSENEDDCIDGGAIEMKSKQALRKDVNERSNSNDPTNIALHLRELLPNVRAFGFNPCTFTSLKSTISRDNTTGDCARKAKLLAEFAQKLRSEARLGPGQSSDTLTHKSRDVELDEMQKEQHKQEVKLAELRKEMARGNPTPRSNPFEYEIKTAEPRPRSYGRPPPGYATYDGYDNTGVPIKHPPKKSMSYESNTNRGRERPYARKDSPARGVAAAGMRRLQNTIPMEKNILAAMNRGPKLQRSADNYTSDEEVSSDSGPDNFTDDEIEASDLASRPPTRTYTRRPQYPLLGNYI
jgi:hypothetical protein